MQKENRRKYVVLNLNVFGFDIVANEFVYGLLRVLSN
jgi:hypothetical protein